MAAARAFGDEAANILERATNGVLNRNPLLYFAYADFEEGRMKYEKVHQMYNKLLAINDVDPTLVSGELGGESRRVVAKQRISLTLPALRAVHEVCSACRGNQVGTGDLQEGSRGRAVQVSCVCSGGFDGVLLQQGQGYRVPNLRIGIEAIRWKS